MHVLLVEPRYYTQHPPLGLLKLAAYHRQLGDTVELVRNGWGFVCKPPHLIYVTSLFTYAWKPVHEAVRFYRVAFPKVPIILGGIYATLMPEHAELSGADEVRTGLVEEVEDLLPDYSLVPECKASVLFASRGCIRRCPFCAVPMMEPVLKARTSIASLICPGHGKVILWDNNFLGTPYWRDVVGELKELNLRLDFNQGLDARLITEEVARHLRGLRIYPIRMAYDVPQERRAVARAIGTLELVGFHKRDMIVYTLYNFRESPDEFLDRLRDLLEWGVVAYPMRFEPLDSLEKNKHIGPRWSAERLDMVARARRVIGYGGAFPPYEGLKRKFLDARSFEEAFGLRGPRERRSGRNSQEEVESYPLLPVG